MTSKATTAESRAERESRYTAEIDQGLGQIANIRRNMKKTDVELRRLEASTRRKLDLIRANLHVKKAA